MRYWLGLLVILLAATCSPPAASTPDTTVQAAQIDLIIDPTPAAVGEASLIVTVTRDGAPLADAPVAVRGDMNHAGMRPVLGEATTDADGKAIIPFRWSMGGDWVVTITVTLPDSSEVSQEFDVSVAT
ncbi:MAG: FixH family protein [Anaerolineae bacterium]|nr:FixH family protein [Anaerolineae bacterium]